MNPLSFKGHSNYLCSAYLGVEQVDSFKVSVEVDEITWALPVQQLIDLHLQCLIGRLQSLDLEPPFSVHRKSANSIPMSINLLYDFIYIVCLLYSMFPLGPVQHYFNNSNPTLK